MVLATLLTCQLMIILDATVMNVALPRIQADLHFSATSLSWVINIYTLVFGGLLLLGGRAGDLFGRRRLFIGGLTLFTIASLAGGFADSATWLLAARVAQGLGAAAAGPSTLALLTTTFTEPRARLRALALFSGMASAGFAVGLILGGLLTEWFSWRSVLFINVPFGIAAVAFAARYVREPERNRGNLDLPGAVTATGGIAAVVYGFIRAASNGWGDSWTLVALFAGIGLLGAFIAIEVRTEQPLLPLRLFADRNRAAAYVNFCLGPMAGMSMFFFLSQYLQDVHGYGALATGFAFLPMAVLVFTMSRLIPRLLPRFGPKPVALTGTVLMAGGLALLTRLSVDSGYFPLLFVPMVLMGLGMGLAFSPLNVIIMSTVPPKDAGAAGGVLQTMQQVGATLGLAILVTIFGTATRNAPGSPHQVLVHGMTSAFFASVVIAALAFAVALTFRKVAR
ncbi:MFS transporter [Amycolatopsis alkalitolerans]|uniref:MFS transporter n=1 Tax=Amycolatopsis alkalitolerans TaxID=2547244 RepID=A0A5C4LRU2_9PSEU|nr:MFS transporter [Amycolatopsis alkalitolerans]